MLWSGINGSTREEELLSKIRVRNREETESRRRFVSIFG